MGKNIFIPGPVGNLEARIHGDINALPPILVCHPHPLYKGCMDNKVISSCVRAADELSLSSLCFNYRGVNKSEGDYSGLDNALLDAEYAYKWLHSNYQAPVILMGFSFGSYLAYRLAEKYDKNVIMIAPPIHKMPFGIGEKSFQAAVIQGLDDKIASAAKSEKWALDNDVSYYSLENTGHFFHGKLNILIENIVKIASGYKE